MNDYGDLWRDVARADAGEYGRLVDIIMSTPPLDRQRIMEELVAPQMRSFLAANPPPSVPAGYRF